MTQTLVSITEKRLSSTPKEKVLRILPQTSVGGDHVGAMQFHMPWHPRESEGQPSPTTVLNPYLQIPVLLKQHFSHVVSDSAHSHSLIFVPWFRTIPFSFLLTLAFPLVLL